MSGLQPTGEQPVNGVDVREQGNALRVATNTPHLVSLGTGRLSTAVTLHPVKQGRVTIGSDPTCDIHVVGTGVSNLHCRVENSHGVVTLYPVNGSTLLDGLPVEKPTRLSQGSMLTIGRSNYLRFNHPEEAKLMKSVLPSAHLSMAPIQFQPNEECLLSQSEYASQSLPNNQCYQTYHQRVCKENTLSSLDHELDLSLKELSRRKPPSIPRKPYRGLDYSDSNSDQESQKPKMSSIMAKVSKFEYYAKTQQKTVGRSQFYTTTETTNEISPKVFSANSLTVNTPAKDVLGGKNAPANYAVKENNQKVVANENNMDPKNCSYANVSIRKTKIDDIVRNFDDNRNGDVKTLKKVNNDEQNKNEGVYGRINKDIYENNERNLNINIDECTQSKSENIYGKVCQRHFNEFSTPSPSFNRNPEYVPVYGNTNHLDRSTEAESKHMQAYQNRLKEEQQKQAETARLEEILNMCAEYERQISSGAPITPTEKRSQNKIITNGSLPRSVVLNHPNIVQTSDGYYKFDTSHNRNNILSTSLPLQRNLSSYENFDISQMSIPSAVESPATPEVTIRNQNLGRMDEIGIPVFDEASSPKNFPITELSSPIMIRKIRNAQQNGELPKIPINLTSSSPIGSPYENMYINRNNVYGNLKPKSPNTQSPRTRIKTSFAHKNLPSPQYFVFPTPPPVEDASKKLPGSPNLTCQDNDKLEERKHKMIISQENQSFGGIEKQLSLEEEIPMIDDSNLTDDIEFRYSRIISELKEPVEQEVKTIEVKVESNENNDSIVKRNQSFDDIKKELMADIPELDEFEKDLKEKNRDILIENLSDNIQTMVIETKMLIVDGSEETENLIELKSKYENLKDVRKKYVAEIHDIKCKMSEIRSQEDDILRELEMEKALIKGEYDSEIAILNIEQKKKIELLEKAKKVEEDIRRLKEKQEARQNEMRDRVEIATLKVERIERDLRDGTATLEELQNAQDILDNETKIYEDLEFQHLEEESEMLAYREDLQNEIIILTKKIEAQKSRILNLKAEANSNLTSALDETKVLQAEYVRLLNQVEELTGNVQAIEKELKPLVAKLNDIERTQSPDSAFYTDQTRTKSGEFGYSPQSSDSDDLDLSKIVNYDDHRQQLRDKFNSIDQMSQSVIVDIERRDISDLIDDVTMNDSRDNSGSLDLSQRSDRHSESPSKSSNSSKEEKKGFWERNFDSLSRLKKDKKSKTSPAKVDVMSQSLNENVFYNNDNIESDIGFDKFNSLRLTKSKKDKKAESNSTPTKSSLSSSKIPTFAALGKIMKRDSFGKKSKENGFTPTDDSSNDSKTKNRYVKNAKPTTDNKYVKAKSQSPDKVKKVEEVVEIVELKEDSPNQKGHNVTFEELVRKTSKDNTNDIDKFNINKLMHRKSCGDEPGLKSDVQRIADTGKIPSQDDIDRISKVTLDAPILSNDADMNSLGRRTFDSLMEIERKRFVMLEEQGCQVIENEREKISELKRRVQNETRKLWDQKVKTQETQNDNDVTSQRTNEESIKIEFPHMDTEPKQDSPHELSAHDSFYDRDLPVEDSSILDDSFNTTNSIYEESSGMVSSSIEELQTRDSRTDSVGSRPQEDGRPLSHLSDSSRERAPGASSNRMAARRTYSEVQRPLTRYLPVDRDDFDLRRHIETAGHQVELCPHVIVNSTSCRGYLHKLGAKFHTWSKRWFVFDRDTKTFVYYWDKSEKKPRGGAYFQVIDEVYLDHGNQSRSPNPQNTFVVKTRQRRYYLMSPSGEAARIWIDVIFTGAQGYTDYLE